MCQKYATLISLAFLLHQFPLNDETSSMFEWENIVIHRHRFGDFVIFVCHMHTHISHTVRIQAQKHSPIAHYHHEMHSDKRQRKQFQFSLVKLQNIYLVFKVGKIAVEYCLGVFEYDQRAPKQNVFFLLFGLDSGTVTNPHHLHFAVRFKKELFYNGIQKVRQAH